MSCIVNFKQPIEVDLPTREFGWEVCLIERARVEGYRERITTIYFETKHLPVLQELVAALEKIEAEKAAVVVEKTDHAEAVQA